MPRKKKSTADLIEGSGQMSGSQDVVRAYLEDIGRYPLLTKEEEFRLSELVRAGLEAEQELAQNTKSGSRRQLLERMKQGREAQERLIVCNLRLVVSIARKFSMANLALADLIQYGNFGLMHAVTKFDGRKGFKFSTYATWWIRQAIQRGIADSQSTIYLPDNVRTQFFAVTRTVNELYARLGRYPTDAEVEHETNIPAHTVQVLRNSQFDEMHSFEEQIGDTLTLGDTVADSNADTAREALDNQSLGLIGAYLDRLNDERQKQIILYRYGFITGQQMSYDATAAYFKSNVRTVRNQEKRAFAIIRHLSERGDLPDGDIRHLLNVG